MTLGRLLASLGGVVGRTTPDSVRSITWSPRERSVLWHHVGVWGGGRQIGLGALLIRWVSAFLAPAFNFRKAPSPIPPGSQAPPRISITAQSSTDSAHESFTAAEGPARRCSSADGLDGPAMGARTLELAPVPPRASPKPPTLIIKTIPGREELRSLARQRKWRPSIGVQVWKQDAPTAAQALAGWRWIEGVSGVFRKHTFSLAYSGLHVAPVASHQQGCYSQPTPCPSCWQVAVAARGCHLYAPDLLSLSSCSGRWSWQDLPASLGPSHGWPFALV